MQRLSLELVTAALTLSALAQSPVYGQCGGVGWTGSTSCVAGSSCVKQNDYYSQCVPGSSAPTTTAAPTTTSKPATTTTVPTTTAPAPPSSTGFVKASGQRFTLNGSPFTVAGTNSYWINFMGLDLAGMTKAFGDIAAAKLTVVRTWGFNEVTSPSGIYYQSWSGSTPTVNTGATGLQNFDNVVAAARANGLRLIVALTNNWSDYGGMDVYVKQILNSANHDLFYTDATVKAAYKKYLSTFIGRYKNEPTIMAWELANEPRCRGSSGTSTGTCTTATVTAWAKEISAYIKSIDSNHLVGLGDEGFFNQPSNPSYPYQGSEGVDFTANLAISTLDFGTFHLYPVGWGQTTDPTGWGVQWINDHATAQKSANKPVLLEEFGVTDNQVSTYQQWYSTVLNSSLTGDLIWQAGSHTSAGDSWDDGYMIFPEDPVYPLFAPHAAALKARG